ncbi:hypothetical protein DP117_04850 [Brasilonema sp. UFV-L1]|nr:hypothetical protein [Brasilonema sp. UFV-L1]
MSESNTKKMGRANTIVVLSLGLIMGLVPKRDAALTSPDGVATGKKSQPYKNEYSTTPTDQQTFA